MTARPLRAPAARPEPRPAQRRAAPRPARRPPAPAQRPRARRRARPGGLAWIPVLALLLGGIVWVNVAKLRVTTTTSQVVQRAQAVESETVRLRARLGQERPAIAERAQTQLGMRYPSGPVTYLDPPR